MGPPFDWSVVEKCIRCYNSVKIIVEQLEEGQFKGSMTENLDRNYENINKFISETRTMLRKKAQIADQLSLKPTSENLQDKKVRGNLRDELSFSGHLVMLDRVLEKLSHDYPNYSADTRETFQGITRSLALLFYWEKELESEKYSPSPQDSGASHVEAISDVVNLLDKALQLYGVIGNDDMEVYRCIALPIQKLLRRFFGLDKDGLLVICQWEAPKAFHQWCKSLQVPDKLTSSERAAAFRKSLVIFEDEDFLKASTLEEFIAQTKKSKAEMILEMVTRGLSDAVGEDDRSLLSSKPSRSMPIHVLSEDSTKDPPCQMLLFEKYVIFGTQTDDYRKMYSTPLYYISNALRCRPSKTPTISYESKEDRTCKVYISGMTRVFHAVDKGKSETLLYALEPLTDMTTMNSFSCWTELFKPYALVVSSEYRSLAGSHHRPRILIEQGLSLSFDLMVHLAAIELCVRVSQGKNSKATNNAAPAAFGNNSQVGLVLCGFFTALVPMKQYWDTVWWHLECSESSKVDSEVEPISPYTLRSTQGDWLKVTDYKALRGKKCILGWWDEANIMLGTKELRKPVRFSKPSSTKIRSLHIKEIATMGQIGVGTVVPISIQSGATFQFVSNVQRFERENSYTMALYKMARDIALVYDAESQQGWLVPKLSLILHMSHTYYDRVLEGQVTSDPIPYAEPSSDGAAAALAALQGKGRTVVCEGNGDGDILLSSVIARIHTNVCEANRTQEKSKAGRFLAPQYLNMVEEPSRGSAITITKTPRNNKAWLGLIDRVDCVIVCAGLGEAIRPITASGRCTKGCDQLPSGKGYLAAHFWCLDKLLQRRGQNFSELSERAIEIDDNQIWIVHGSTFHNCDNQQEHSPRWESTDTNLQQVKGRKWERPRSTRRPRLSDSRASVVGPSVTGAAVFGIPGK